MKPPYSKEGEDLKIQGTVLVQFVVRSNGSTDSFKVLRSLGHGFDETAVETVRKWRFRPAMKDGRPVDCYAQVEVNFRLSGGASPLMGECVENCSMKAPYTDEARKLAIQGRVDVGFLIRADGTTSNFHIISGLGHGLDESAIGTVAK